MNAKPFIELLRRAMKSKYSTFIMNNRMLMQCYTIDEDSDVGLHYILHIPETEDYLGSFWDETLFIDAKAICNLYTEGHKVYTEKKKEKKAKSKDCREEMHGKLNDKGDIYKIKFLYIVNDEIVDVRVHEIPYPLSNTNPVVENIEKSITDLFHRIKAGGIGATFDGLRYGIVDSALESPDINFFKIKMNDVKIKIPIYKSMFAGLKDLDEFYISIISTTIDHTYLFCYQLTAKGITDQYYGYLLAY